jgi:Metallo-peptidase family M12B Reprolysin-like
MKKTKPGLQLSLFICALIISMPGLTELRAQDQITLNNNSANPIGLLVDGKLAGSFVNDKTYVSPGSPALIGQFSAINGNKTNEIVAFSQDRPMAIYTNVPWTTGNDNIVVSFANKILIPVTIWIVYGDVAAVTTKATSDLLTTSTIFGTERVGVDFSTVTFRDATANPLAPNYYNYDDNVMASSIKTDIGYVTGQINVYCVRSLIFSGAQYLNGGQATFTGGPSIAISSQSTTNVLAHEFGHLFSLAHTNSGAATQWFDYTNLMSTNGSPGAAYLTEGQVFRMHINGGSVLNQTYNARPGQPTRFCDGTSTTATNTCPGVQKRIWADGTYPAN